MSQQKSSKPETAAPVGVAYLIGRLDHVLSRRMRDALAPIGLTVSQYTALSFLARGSLSNAQLAERALISPQAANEMVKAMESRGWLTREPDPGHGRIIRIGLTAEGQSMLAQGDHCAVEVEARMLSGHSPQQSLALREELKQVLRALSEPEL